MALLWQETVEGTLKKLIKSPHNNYSVCKQFNAFFGNLVLNLIADFCFAATRELSSE